METDKTKRFFFVFWANVYLYLLDIDINIGFILLARTLCYGNDTLHRLDKKSLQDAPASLQVRPENKMTKQKCILNWL